jgi:hypothetical protein
MVTLALILALVSTLSPAPSAKLKATRATLFVAPSGADTRGISEARSIARTVGDKLWPHWAKTPFVIDLVTSEYEILLGAPRVPTGFTRLQNGDSYRKRSFAPNLEATFPAFDTLPIIVIGEQPFTAAKTATRWTVTLLHEHFHQWQNSWPAYYNAVRSLKLAHGDNTGMWMLNYAFPYGSLETNSRFKNLTVHLAAAVEAIGTPTFKAALQSYLGARARWRSALKPDDYRYFAFQCWQEGTARYTEYRVAQLAAQQHDSTSTFLTASQSRLLEADARRTYEAILRILTRGSLQNDRRSAFYAVGAGEGMLLDRTSDDWHERYLNANMDLIDFFGLRRRSSP